MTLKPLNLSAEQRAQPGPLGKTGISGPQGLSRDDRSERLFFTSSSA